MKNIKYSVFLLIFIFLITIPRIAAPQYRNLKQNLAIIDFENRTAFEDVGEGAQGMLTTALWKSDRFVLLERERIRQVLDEQDFSYSGRVRIDDAIKIGKIIGADYILTGGVTEAGFIKDKRRKASRVALDARLIDITSSQIIFAETAFGKVRGGDINAAIRMAVDDLVVKIIETVDKEVWQSSIMKIDGQAVYINAGLEHGIQKGDIFIIYKEGEELIDPKTKVVIGHLSKRIGEIEIIEIQAKYSIAAIIKGIGFETGDIVKQE